MKWQEQRALEQGTVGAGQIARNGTQGREERGRLSIEQLLIIKTLAAITPPSMPAVFTLKAQVA